MRFRLTKQNIKDLIDGKPLKNGKTEYLLESGETQERKTLRLILDSGELGKRASVFIEAHTSRIEVEIDGKKITGMPETK